MNQTPVRLVQIALTAVAAGVILSVVAFVAFVPGSDRGAANRDQAEDADSVDLSGLDEGVGGVAIGVEGAKYEGGQRSGAYQFDVARELEDGTEFTGFRVQSKDSTGDIELWAERAKASGDRMYWRADGGVAVSRSDGARIEADWAEHYEREKADVVGGNVFAVDPSRRLRCDRAEYQSETQSYIIDGDIRLLMNGATAIALSADRVRFHHGKDAVVEGRVQVASGRLAATAERIEASLDGAGPRHIALRGDGQHGVWVESWGQPTAADCDPTAWLKRAWSNDFDIEFEKGRPRTLRPTGPVLVEGIDPPRQLWRLLADVAVITLTAGGNVESIWGQGVSWSSIEPDVDGLPMESWYAPQAIAEFDASGGLGRVELPEGVKLRRGTELFLEGAGGHYADGRLIMDRSPRLVQGNATMTANQIEIDRAAGILIGQGDVRVEAPAGDSRLGGDGQPVRVRADRMATEGGGDTVVYSGNATMWSGRDLLSASEIRADKDFARLQAAGSAHLVVASNPQRPTDATADQLDYRHDGAVLRGAVTMVTPDLRLQAEEVRIVFVSGSDEIERIEADGAPVVGRREGRTTYSERLVHLATDGRTILGGILEVPRIIDPDGHETSGEPLVLWVQGEKVMVGSEVGGAAYTRVGNKRNGGR